MKFSLEKPFPLEDGSYDHVLCLNVLERIYDHVNVLRESYRILKPGGSMIHFTPFLVQEHEGPYDFFRYTKGALRRLYEDAGFIVKDVQPAEYGAFKCVYQYTHYFIPVRILRAVYREALCGLEALIQKTIQRYARLAPSFVLAYTLVATKPSVDVTEAETNHG